MDTGDKHTYSTNCRLAPVIELDHQDARLDGIPPINAQFFYHSLIPIDDPLSTATVATVADGRSTKSILRPFSRADNNALERAWLSFASDEHRRSHNAALKDGSTSPVLVAENARKLDSLVDQLIRKHTERHFHESHAASFESPQEPLASTGFSICCQDLQIDASTKIKEVFCQVSRKTQPALNQEHVMAKVMSALERDRPRRPDVEPITIPTVLKPLCPAETFVSPGLSTSARRRASSLASNPADCRPASVGSRAKAESAGSFSHAEQLSSALSTPSSRVLAISGPARPPTVDNGISGRPFLKVGDIQNDALANPVATSSDSSSSVPKHEAPKEPTDDDQPLQASATQTLCGSKKSYSDIELRMTEVPVGISKLHEVSMPVLQMKPIYWSPVNDIAVVSRATWFFRDTMVPVESIVANQLESGYRELRAFSQEWQEEIRCAVEVGPLGEEKVSHPLWPPVMSSTTAKPEAQDGFEPSISSDPFCAARCFRGEAAAEGTLEPVLPGEDEYPCRPDKARSYASWHVLYKDSKTAFLLKPSLKPSAYYGRRPLQKIMKGITVGIPVIRGFNRDIWDQLHEKKRASKKQERCDHAFALSWTSMPEQCPACQLEKNHGQVTDLVLVAHGIGQKFAERVESFHFTHAVAAFRRSINIELMNSAVQSVLRKGYNGIMVLPVNWRHYLSFEDGGPLTDTGKDKSATDHFGLRDIEPHTIPAVRTLVSDVMFDIPFYMSQHKPKMVSALVSEANRVFRLWCRNNPEFLGNGRVHLIAHSLGSVMALEVLSKQPSIPPQLDLRTPIPHAQIFEFDTTNLFLLGSPAGFFLLLERGCLMPRKGRQKPGKETTDTIAQGVVGEAGAFGCLAVDNIYNILAKEDPIAYLLNGTIDPVYAANLKRAHVPSTATSWFQRWLPAGAAPSSELHAPPLSKPATNRLPFQLELEVHDFTREEISERKAFLLNDNGQVDYYLRSGTGPLELQYLNMLSAHTSYWTNQDLIRLLCMEIGRAPGRENTLPALRAVKLTRRDRLKK